MLSTLRSVPAVPAAEIADGGPATGTVPLILEITKGRTRFRRRPVAGPRFLIGAGLTCDLRLGGDSMPALHSLITTGGGEIALEAIAADPPLTVNGRQTRTAELRDGDIIAIGELELVARISARPAPVRSEAATPAPTVESVVERPLADLSAAELVELIEQEEMLIEQFDQRRREGVDALVDVVLGRTRSTAQGPRVDSGRSAPIKAPHFLSKRPQILAAQGHAEAATREDREAGFQHELEELGRQLTALSHELQDGSMRSHRRESHYADATNVLMETQQKLVSQVEVLLSHVETLKDRQSPAVSPRAIA